MSIRPVTHIGSTQPTLEGAGVRLERVFGFQDPEMPSPTFWPAPLNTATAWATAATWGRATYSG